MNILIDINHPAHVHYFRGVHKRLSEDGHNVIVVTRNKEIEEELLTQYSISFIRRGVGASSILGKIFYHIYAVIKLTLLIRKYKIDKVLSFMHPYAAQAAWIMRKKSILFSDTENANLHHKLSVPFATEVHTPSCFERDLGEKHFRFSSFMELSYLHPDIFKVDDSVLHTLAYDSEKPITVIRFVSWGAVHDIGHNGIDEKDKIKFVSKLSLLSNVFISSESQLPDELKKFELNIDKTKMHDLLYHSDLFIGESATMASESAMLGTPAIYIDTEGRGYTNYLESKYGIVFNYTESKEDVAQAFDHALKILDEPIDSSRIRESILAENINTSDYIYSQVIKD